MTTDKMSHGYPGCESTMNRTGMTSASSTPPLWRTNDSKARKEGQRSTIYWVGKSIVGEDGAPTGQRSKGASYNGEWGANLKNGYGVQMFPNGDKYEGQWTSGKRHGEGVLWIPAQKSGKLRKLYIGGWKEDRRHGKGTCFFKSGEFYQGTWDSGMMHGQGQLRYETGDLYIGQWHNGQRSGQGTLNKENGDCYEGYWLNDKREGSGSYFYSVSGKVFVGEWVNDMPKAGVYTQAHPNPEQAAAVPQTSTLPSVRLALPVEVLDGALAAVRNARKAYRAQNTPITRLFAEDEVAALRTAFEGAQRPDGSLAASDLADLFVQLGMEVAAPRITQLLKAAGVPEDSEAVRFQDFARVIALLLDEEASIQPSEEEPAYDSTMMEGWDDAEGAPRGGDGWTTSA